MAALVVVVVVVVVEIVVAVITAAPVAEELEEDPQQRQAEEEWFIIPIRHLTCLNMSDHQSLPEVPGDWRTAFRICHKLGETLYVTGHHMSPGSRPVTKSQYRRFERCNSDVASDPARCVLSRRLQG